MTRESFLSRKNTPTEIELDDGTIIKARKLKQSEVELIRRKFATADKALEGFRYVVMQCVVEDDDRPMFTESDSAALLDIDFNSINRIATAVMKASGLATDAKNA